MEEIKALERKIADNVEKIAQNEKRITQNSGALEILKTFKADSQRFFTMWIITFVALLFAVGYIIYLKEDTNTIITDSSQEVEQENDNGSNYFIGGDGEING